jgi:hypothetical protein
MTVERSLEGLPVEGLARVDGYEVHTADGERAGYVDLIFVDAASGVPEWLGVWNGHTTIGEQRWLMPVTGARQVGSEVHVPWTKDQIGQAPGYHEGLLHDKPAEVQITREMEDAAYALYGVAPVTAPPAADYVVRITAVVITQG